MEALIIDILLYLLVAINSKNPKTFFILFEFIKYIKMIVTTYFAN